jgi:hypothetical protein
LAASGIVGNGGARVVLGVGHLRVEAGDVFVDILDAVSIGVAVGTVIDEGGAVIGDGELVGFLPPVGQAVIIGIGGSGFEGKG